MEFASYFIKDKAWFGTYPTNQQVKELEILGVKYFIDLTCKNENVIKYSTKYSIINYPILDRSIPNNIKKFCQFIVKISNIINKNINIYIHCRGGHGRSGLVVACLLSYLYDYLPEKSLNLTNLYHNNRIKMRNIWRKLGSPQTREQKTFVYKLFKPLYFYRAFSKGPSSGLSNYSKHPIQLDNIGTFLNSQKAYYALKFKDDQNCIEKLIKNKTHAFIYNKKSPKNWHLKKKDVMHQIILLKMKQHPSIKDNLINTGFRKIIYNSKNNNYWGVGSGNGLNILGNLWYEIKMDLLFS